MRKVIAMSRVHKEQNAALVKELSEVKNRYIKDVGQYRHDEGQNEILSTRIQEEWDSCDLKLTNAKAALKFLTPLNLDHLALKDMNEFAAKIVQARHKMDAPGFPGVFLSSSGSFSHRVETHDVLGNTAPDQNSTKPK